MLLFGCASPCAAQSDEEQLLADLLDVMSEETELATKTRLNTDFVPGLVSVLERERLLGLGMRTVWDALVLVPGVEPALDDRGTPTVTVRGLPFPFNSGNIKILLNGVPTGREAAGVNSSVLFLPLSQVERIEFIRGPGSVVYGDFAFQGLLNVITMQGSSGGGVTVADDSMRQAQARLADAGEGWRYAVDASAQRADRAPLPIGRTGDDHRHSVLAFVQRGDFSLQTHSVRRDLDEAGGPDADYHENSFASELRYGREIDSGLEFQARLHLLDTDIDKRIVQFRAREYELGVDWIWQASDAHQWLMGVESQLSDIDEGVIDLRGSPLFPPILREPLRDQQRRQHALFAQDQWRVAESLTLTYGLRYDDIDDIGSRITPRVSAVWQFADQHLLKLQYAEGFRGPTFFELHGSTSTDRLRHEVNRTSELTYVFKNPQRTARATLFRSRYDDMFFITFPELGFDNVADAESRGVEIEWSQQIGDALRLDAQYSRTHSEDTRNPLRQSQDITSTPDHLGHLALLYRHGDDDLFGLRWIAVGDRPSTSGYDQLGLSYTRSRFLSPSIELRVGIDNVGNARAPYPLPGPLGDIPFVYQDRVSWVELSWQPQH